MQVLEMKPTVNSLGESLFIERFLQNPDSETETGRGQILRYWNGEFYGWVDGVYKKVPDIKMEIRSYLIDLGVEVKAALVNDIEKVLSIHTYLSSEVKLDSWVDNEGARVFTAQNGNISFSDLDAEGMPRLLPHCQEYFTLSKMPFDYDPKAECPKWNMFLHQIMQGDIEKILLLQSWAGYLITDNLKSHKFLMCVGEGANGKSVFFEIVKKLIGANNCTHTPLSRFGDRFGLESIVGKKLISITESCQRIDSQAEMALKSLTSGDSVTIERKYKGSLDYVPQAKVMIATNSLPSFSDKSSGIWRRMLLVPFEYQVPAEEQNPDLIDELTEELAGIFNWAYEGYRSYNEYGFIIPQSSTKALVEYKKDVNPAKAFLEEEFEYDSVAEGIECGNLYQEYRGYASENGFKSLSNSNFGKEVLRAFPQCKKRRISKDGSRPYIYEGLRRVAESDIADFDV